VAGSHGFDIGGHRDGTVRHDAVTGFEDLLSTVTHRLNTEVGSIEGAVIEPKRFSVAVHYRRVAPKDRPSVTATVDTLLAEYPDRLKVTPGKMVYEIQPKVDWDKGKAVQYLRHALGVEGEEFVALYLGDDITDEDAFTALKESGNGQGIGVVVADLGDEEQADRVTAADFVLESTGEVQQFLNALAHSQP
jgi:trehalose 6-phosphate phosphatase